MFRLALPVIHSHRHIGESPLQGRAVQWVNKSSSGQEQPQNGIETTAGTLMSTRR